MKNLSDTVTTLGEYDSAEKVLESLTTLEKDRYVPTEAIASTVGCTLYKAQDTVLDRTVALKVFTGYSVPPGKRNPYAHIRDEANLLLLKEAQTIAQLNSRIDALPKIHTVAKSADGYLAIVMEYIQGQTLNEWVELHKNDDNVDILLAAILSNICYAVEQVLHSGVTHRDLKPTNILVQEIDTDVFPRLIDFDACTSVAPEDDRIGTQEYMSPEVRHASIDRLPGIWGEKTEMYALGVTLQQACSQLKLDSTHDLSTIADKASEFYVPQRFESLKDLRMSLDKYIKAQFER